MKDEMPSGIEDILFSYLSILKIGCLLTFNNSLMSMEKLDVVRHKLSHKSRKNVF